MNTICVYCQGQPDNASTSNEPAIRPAIALPSAVKVFNWLGTIWGSKIQFTTPMLFSLSFVSMFIIGGLSGIFMAATPVDIFIHDTYFIVAHFHYVLFAGTAMGVFGAIYFWFPKMFGRMMNDNWGKVHFFLTFIFLNGTFFTMHILGAVGFPGVPFRVNWASAAAASTRSPADCGPLGGRVRPRRLLGAFGLPCRGAAAAAAG